MTQIIPILFWIVAVLALLHLVWNGLVSPVIRLHFRYRLFALRDKVRRAKVEDGQKPELNKLETAINSGIFLVHNFGLVDYIRAFSSIRNTPDREKAIELSGEMEDVMNELCRYVLMAVFVNSMVMFTYIIPLAASIHLMQSVKTMLFRKTERELHQYFPRNYAT